MIVYVGHMGLMIVCIDRIGLMFVYVEQGGLCFCTYNMVFNSYVKYVYLFLCQTWWLMLLYVEHGG